MTISAAEQKARDDVKRSASDLLALTFEFVMDALIIRYAIHLSWTWAVLIPYVATPVTFNLRKIRRAIEG